MSWYKKAQSVEDEFPYITLYHGTLSVNATSIKYEGIVPKKAIYIEKIAIIFH